MSKRFTETDKWRSLWWRELSPSNKLLWLYILDNCNPAGIWSPDIPLAEFSIGAKIDLKSFQKNFNDKISILPDGKWYVKNFIQFQKGVNIKDLNKKNKAHLGVLRCMDIYKKTDFSDSEQELLFSSNEAPSKEHQSSIRVRVKEEVKEEVVFSSLLDKYGVSSLRGVWGEWEIHRKEKRSGLTRSTAEKQIKFLAKHGAKDATEIIENSIRNGYIGLFETNTKRGKVGGNNIAEKLKGG